MIKNEIHLDNYGRITIDDPELLAAISGAAELADLNNLIDGGCGNNDSCTNASC